MSDNLSQTLDQQKQRSLFIPSLAISRFAIQPPLLLIGLLLIDIGSTFNLPVGVTGQLRTTAALFSAVSAILMGVLSIKYKKRNLLLLGLVISSVSALIASFALNFPMMLISYSLAGISLAMVEPMLYALVGEHILLDNRPRAIGWVLTGAASCGIVGAPIIGILSGIGDWRLSFLGFALPVMLISLGLAILGIPSPNRGQNASLDNGTFSEGFKKIFFNKSATACLLATIFSYAGWQAVVLYGASLFREVFQSSLSFATIVVFGISLGFILGSQAGSRLINKFGRKTIVISGASLTGIFIIAFAYIEILEWAFVFILIASFFGGMRTTASNSLTLEQVPIYRGSMMSLNSASWNIGVSLGAGIGGIILLLSGYKFLGLFLGLMLISAALIYYFAVNDPT